MGMMKPLVKEEIPDEYIMYLDLDDQWIEKNEKGRSRSYVRATCPTCGEPRNAAINDIRNWCRNQKRSPHFPITHRACRFTKRSIDKEGYVRIYVGYKDGHSVYKPEHRAVMEEILGRPLTSDETIHHIDGNRQNNEPSNLQLRTGRHGKGIKQQCIDCGSHNITAIELD